MNEYDDVAIRRCRPRHIRDLDTNGLSLRFEQIGKYIEEYLRNNKQYEGEIEFIEFSPEDAMRIFEVEDVGGAKIEQFNNVRIFSKNRINVFLDNLLKDFNGKLPPIGLIFIVPIMGNEEISLNVLMENEENFQNPGLFRNAPFAFEEKTRFCALLLPLKCNPAYLGRNSSSQSELAKQRGQEILAAVEISYVFLALKELLGRFYPFIPHFLRASSRMKIKSNGGEIKEKIVLIGENCNHCEYSQENRPGIRFSTSEGEPAMHIGAAPALVKVFTEDDIAGAR